MLLTINMLFDHSHYPALSYHNFFDEISTSFYSTFGETGSLQALMMGVFGGILVCAQALEIYVMLLPVCI